MKILKVDISKPKEFLSKLFLLAIIISVFELKSEAQIAGIGGGNLSTIRNEVELENEESILGYHFGFQIQYYPVKNFERWSIINELIFTGKGYKQQFDKDYFFHFNYLALPVLVNFSPISFLSVQGGAEFSKLISTNLEQGLKTYNNYDIGLVLGLTAFDNNRISIYSRVTYGLLPMLDYALTDELGNFVDEIEDLRNVYYSLGIRIKLWNDKIKFSK